MKRHLLQLLCLAAAAAPSAGATGADQSAQSAGAHELPAFVRGRIELTPGASDDFEPAGLAAQSDPAARTVRAIDGVLAR